MGKPKEYRGEFWLASHPSHRVAGTLTFHPKRQGELRLHESLEPGLAHERQEWDRIMGDVLGGSCVLYHCFWLGSRSSEESPGVWVEQPRIFVNALMTMPKTDSVSPPERFSGLTATFRGLPEFDGRQAFGSDNDRDEGVERVTARRLDPLKVSTARATYAIRQGTGSRSSNFKAWSVTSTHWLVIEPHVPATLDELLDLLSTFRTFIALAMHQDCRMKGPITLFPSRGPDDAGTDRSVRSHQYHAVWRRGTKHSYDFYNRVLSWDSMGAEGVARWLDLEGECGHVIDRLSSMRFVKHLAFEDALVRLMAAADSLHRVVTGRSKTGAETVLKDLARYAGPPFTNAVPNLDTWAKTVVDERHNAAHNKGNPVTVDLKLTTELVMSVYWLVLLGLLRRADAPDPAMQEAVRSQPFVWPMKRIREQFQHAD